MFLKKSDVFAITPYYDYIITLLFSVVDILLKRGERCGPCHHKGCKRAGNLGGCQSGLTCIRHISAPYGYPAACRLNKFIGG